MNHTHYILTDEHGDAIAVIKRREEHELNYPVKTALDEEFDEDVSLVSISHTVDSAFTLKVVVKLSDDGFKRIFTLKPAWEY